MIALTELFASSLVHSQHFSPNYLDLIVLVWLRGEKYQNQVKLSVEGICFFFPPSSQKHRFSNMSCFFNLFFHSNNKRMLLSLVMMFSSKNEYRFRACGHLEELVKNMGC